VTNGRTSGTVALTRTVTFTAAHRYHRPEWSEDRNREAFGDASLGVFHQHTYVCAVTVSAPVDPATGMLVDLRALDRAIRSEVTERYDGRTLNLDVPEFLDGREIPTGENLVLRIAIDVQRTLGGAVRVTEVSLAEDPMLRATWRAVG
jgi:6-pyruvoyltetrahydropterin/6-carboxytetrahydropterin synthase